MKTCFPLHVHISTLFVLLLLMVGGAIGGVGYYYSRQMLEDIATGVTAQIGGETVRELEGLVAPAKMAIGLVSHDPLVRATTSPARLARLPVLKEALMGSPALSSIYAAYPNGDFVFLRRLQDEAERAYFQAPERTRYIAQIIDRSAEPARGRYIYLDDRLTALREEARPAYAASYDPRSRDWYRVAMASHDPIRTSPYVFFSNRKVGLTIAARGVEEGSVVGADILLETVGEGLARRKLTPGTQLAVVDGAGRMLAHEDVGTLVGVEPGPDAKPVLRTLERSGIPVLQAAAGVFRGLGAGEQARSTTLHLADGSWRVQVEPIPASGDGPMYLLVAVPEEEMFAAALRLRTTSGLLTLGLMLLSIPLTWLLAREIARSIRALAVEAESIRHFEFDRKIEVRSLISEVHQLAVTIGGMKSTIRRFLGISEAVAAEENFDRLLPMLLRETCNAAEADVGILYLVDGERFIPATTHRRDGQDPDLSLQPVVLGQAGGLMSGAVADRQARAAPLAPADIAALGLAGLSEAAPGAQGLALPLLNRRHELVGAMLLLREQPVSEAQLAFLRALSGSAATSLEARELIKAQKALFEAFIQLIAGAIDAKSPYTGGHCARVPELTKLLAKAACEADSGPFKDFRLDEQEWEAVHVAAWLHDCGKVTTPEYVVDKATKLETIHDRIHEVRMRFEVKKRDAEIACLQAIAGGEPMEAARARRDEELRRLDDDFAFVAACNEGGEFMAPDKIERLKAIAAQTWVRTLDDRIGISHEELLRKARVPAPALPVVEPLLADKPEHRILRRPQDRMAPDNPWGFRMAVPELLYNRGEVYNLAVGRGTLSEEERYKINEHIVQTLIMLSQLPFPKHLRQVPEIAGGHHEKMDGSGYPKGLTREQMSPVARMMAIADIFEALTAVDRPYKKGKTLSEAIRIMGFMRREQHIDPDLFELFLRSGAYRQYAERFMAPDQIDAVDVEAVLTPA